MSAGDVLAALEQMEAWLADPGWEPEPEALAQWNVGFQAAMAKAKASEGLSELVPRAHALGRRLETRIAGLVQVQDKVRAELEALECGNRALKGYGASIR